MDGKWLIRQLRGLLKEDEDSDFLTDFESYTYLYDAAVTFAGHTRCLRGTQSITTVADQESYTLNADFTELYLKNKHNNLYIKLNDGSTNHFLTFKEYEEIVYNDDTSSVPLPDSFSINDVESLSDRITGSATGAGTSSAGEATLPDSGGGFSANVSVGDIVHNTTDNSDGVVLSVVSDTELTTALLDGTTNAWAINDEYVIQPQGRLRIILNPPPSTTGYTLTVQYIQRPAPVYSDFGMYRFPTQYGSAIVKYAAWLYKYSDLEPQTGDSLFKYWQFMLKEAKARLDKTFRRTKFTVNLKKRRR